MQIRFDRNNERDSTCDDDLKLIQIDLKKRIQWKESNKKIMKKHDRWRNEKRIKLKWKKKRKEKIFLATIRRHERTTDNSKAKEKKSIKKQLKQQYKIEKIGSWCWCEDDYSIHIQFDFDRQEETTETEKERHQVNIEHSNSFSYRYTFKISNKLSSVFFFSFLLKTKQRNCIYIESSYLSLHSPVCYVDSEF